MHKQFALLAAAAFLLSACQDGVAPTSPSAIPSPQLSVASGDDTSEPIPGAYVVVFKESARDIPGLARALVAAHGGTLRFTYQSALRGFAANL
ncbi:MAG TPA: hypothetical protein VM076_01045, partial [Gemmatimonadaceae bacterium]|nr:hypothetical protein [Gemmatimonadaceae bacterium]